MSNAQKKTPAERASRIASDQDYLSMELAEDIEQLAAEAGARAHALGITDALAHWLEDPPALVETWAEEPGLLLWLEPEVYPRLGAGETPVQAGRRLMQALVAEALWERGYHHTRPDAVAAEPPAVRLAERLAQVEALVFQHLGGAR